MPLVSAQFSLHCLYWWRQISKCFVQTHSTVFTFLYTKISHLFYWVKRRRSKQHNKELDEGSCRAVALTTIPIPTIKFYSFRSNLNNWQGKYICKSFHLVNKIETLIRRRHRVSISHKNMTTWSLLWPDLHLSSLIPRFFMFAIFVLDIWRCQYIVSVNIPIPRYDVGRLMYIRDRTNER